MKLDEPNDEESKKNSGLVIKNLSLQIVNFEDIQVPVSAN